MELTAQYTTNTQKYLVDSEQKKALLASRDEAMSKIQEHEEILQKQLTESQKDGLKLSIQITRAQEEIRVLKQKYEEETAEMMAKYNRG